LLLVNPSLTSVKDLSPDDAKRIYRAWYWKSIGGDELSQDVATALFDTAVNFGVRRATKMLHEVLKVAPAGKLGKDSLDAMKNYQGNLAGDFLDARLREYDRADTPRWSGSLPQCAISLPPAGKSVGWPALASPSMYGANPFAPDPPSWPRNLLDAPLFTEIVTEPKVPR
jgi:hypothetical protein